MRQIDENSMEDILASQISEGPNVETPVGSDNAQQSIPEETVIEAPQKPKSEAAKYLGTQLTHKIGGWGQTDKDADNEMIKEKKLTRIGESISVNADIRDGWIDVDRGLLGERNVFYPADWRFRIRPATVEAIRNWSTLDDENINSIDDVFNEVLKSCLGIITPYGPIPWGNIRPWDRFFFILLIREYTFINGEGKIEYTEDCPECDNPVTFTLGSQVMTFNLPDPEIMHYFSEEDQTWVIDPAEYDVEGENPVTLYLPTLEKDANIKAWLIDKVQNKKKFDEVFIKFLSWMAPKISKDLTIATRQIRECEIRYKNWDTDMFEFMNEVVTNIMITPSTKLIQTCPICGEEVTSDIRFPNGVRSLFDVSNRRKKFGKK